MSNTYYNPKTNDFELWDEKPDGYLTFEEWEALHPAPQPSEEELYLGERANVDNKYSAPWNGLTGGILTVLQMTMTSALCEVPQSPEKISQIGLEYQKELANMSAELEAIDEKYGV